MTEASSPSRFEPDRPRVTLIAAPALDGLDAKNSSVGLVEDAALIASLQQRVSQLEMRLRERDEQQAIWGAELHALERDLEIKEAYVKRLEFEQQLQRTEIGQVRDRAAELFSDLERAEARISELGALAHDIQNQRSYRAVVALGHVVGQGGLARRVLRLLRGPSSSK